MIDTGDRLLTLLPALYRLRDEEEGGPLAALLAVIGREVDVLQEGVAQSYDNSFVETCAEWVLPYIGDLLGARPLLPIPGGAISQRAYVANTLAYRRRKGTAAMLEQLARDVTGWDARAVEFFQILTTTQHVNHRRDRQQFSRHLGRLIHDVRDGTPLEHNLATVDMRDWEPLERINGAFDTLPRTIEVRRVATGRGRFNIPNIGIFLWRLAAQPVTDSPAAAVEALATARRLTFSPLGVSTRLFTRPETEEEVTHLAAPLNVPEPISRQVLEAYLGDYYGRGKSLVLRIAGEDVPAAAVKVCDLSDQHDVSGAVVGWAHLPGDDLIAVDPLLGRIALPAALAGQTVLASYHHGFSADVGGGEYERPSPLADPLQLSVRVARQPSTLTAGPIVHQVVGTALAAVAANGGIVEISDSDRYEEPLSLAVGAGRTVQLRAANGRRPTIVVTGDTFEIAGGSGAVVTIDGLLIAGALHVQGDIACVRLRHCTLVPGLRRNPDGTPATLEPSLTVEGATIVRIEHSIIGGIRVHRSARVTVVDSIVDATAADRAAFAGLPLPSGDLETGGPLVLERATVIGTVDTNRIDLASNAMFVGRVAVERRQQGCVRHSYVPPGSTTPRRFNCQPANDAEGFRVAPRFNSLHFGDPAYCQFAPGCPIEIATGADDGAEMGVFHDLYQPQRLANLRARLDEYLRFGLEAGIFLAT
jgi:hypothetical protein